MWRVLLKALFIWVVVCLLGIFGAAQPTITIQRDLVYGRAGEVDLKLDLYKPGLPGPLPAIIFVHGGGWVSGDKRNMEPMARYFAERGYVGLSVGYRLAPRFKFPAQIEDIKCAVRWVRANAQQLGVNPERIGAMGSSAGGHLVGLLGVTDGSEGLEGSCGDMKLSSRVQAVVPYFGLMDWAKVLGNERAQQTALALFGTTCQADPEPCKRGSPVTYVSSDDPPYLLVHGTLDPVVPFEQSVFMRDTLKAANVEVDLVALEGAGHGWPINSAFGQQALARVVPFFERHLKVQTLRALDAQARTIYFHVALNVNYWDNEPDLKMNVETIKRHIALMQKYKIKADYYFTWLSAKQLMAVAPELFTQLQAAGMGIHHHGANRDPKPQPVQRARGQNWEEDVKAIREYETHDIDPKTGQLLPAVGGLKGLLELYKLPLFSTGRWVKAPILYVTKEFGLKMGVGLTENVGAPRPDAWYLGMLNRPDGPTLTPGDELVPWALTSRGNPIGQLEKEIAQIPPGQFQAVALLMHDTDFVNHPAQAREKIWAAYEKVIQWAVSKLKPATAREFYAMMRSDVERSFTQEQIIQAAEQILRAAESSGAPPFYVDLPGDYLNLADVFQALTASLASYTSFKALPREVVVRGILGPTEEFRSDLPVRQAAVPLPTVAVEQALSVADALQITDRVPARINVIGRMINPAEWLYLAAKVYLQLAGGKANGSISLFAVSLYAPQAQANPKADKLTKLQFWTFKPARWR